MNKKGSSNNEGFCLQLAFLGARKTGKASLIHQVIGNGFVEEGAKENILDCKNKTFDITGMHTAVIMDTSDLHNFPPMKRVAIQRANIFVLVFALDNVETLTEVEQYYHDIVEIKKHTGNYHNDKIPIVVVGNKADFRNIDTKQMEEKITQDWGCKYIEVSARTGSHITDLKNTIIEETKLAYNVPERRKKHSITKRIKSIF